MNLNNGGKPRNAGSSLSLNALSVSRKLWWWSGQQLLSGRESGGRSRQTVKTNSHGSWLASPGVQIDFWWSPHPKTHLEFRLSCRFIRASVAVNICFLVVQTEQCTERCRRSSLWPFVPVLRLGFTSEVRTLAIIRNVMILLTALHFLELK